MSETSISWTDFTFNPWWGCQRVSPGCEHCYAETFAHRLGFDIWGPLAKRRFFEDKHWNEPLKWALARARGSEKHRVFCASMADVFEDCPDQQHDPNGGGCLCAARARLFLMIWKTPELTWQLLTKRPENVLRMVPDIWIADGFPRNVWLMTTCEDQQRANERLPVLLSIPSYVHGVSYEPALGPIDFTRVRPALGGTWNALASRRLHWIIYGGESGAHARPNDVAWARSTRDQCAAHGVSFFMKQAGVRLQNGSLMGLPVFVKRADGDSKGDSFESIPSDLHIRTFPV